MTVTLIDHLFAMLLILPLPLYGAWQFRRLQARIAAGERDARVRVYRGTILEEFALVAAVLAIWVVHDRPWATLAPAAPGPAIWTWVGWAAAAVISLLLILQAVLAVRSAENLAAVRKQLENVAAFLPRTERELHTFWALSLTAGIGEEIVFRGYALAWVAALASSLEPGAAVSLIAAVLGSSVMFGLAHAYQGPSGMLRTGTVGLVLGGLAVATGGLLAPMIVHTVMDVTSGFLAQRALGVELEEDPEPAMAV